MKEPERRVAGVYERRAARVEDMIPSLYEP